MDDLPPQLILEILSRLVDSSDLARCRLTSKTLNSLSYDVTSVNLLCSFAQYTRSRAQASTVPFKSNATRFIAGLSQLSSITVRVDESLQSLSYDDAEDDGDGDDLYLTDAEFVSLWLPAVGDRLETLSFSDFWVQSCWRRSFLLSLISRHCQRLNELKIKKAWLSVDGLSAMSALTTLTLEFVRLDDENLSKVNECFPCLQTLNLLGVGGLKEPKICLQFLKTCQWTVSNVPNSLTLITPKMIKLKLECVRPKALVLETPLLSDLHLTLQKSDTFDVGVLPHLKKLQLESSNLRSLIGSFPCSSAVNELTLESVNKVETTEVETPNLGLLFKVFPSLSSLNLGPSAYADMEASFVATESYGRTGMKGLKAFTAHLVIKDVEVTLSFISFIIDKCNNLSTMSLLIHQELDSVVGSNLISSCMALCPRIRWKWGFWKAGCKDTWVCDVV